MALLFIFRAGLVLALCGGAAFAQGAAAFQSELLRLKPTYLWTFDRSYSSVGSAGAAALETQGGRFVSDLDGKEASAVAFDNAHDGLVLPGDPITGGGAAANPDADGTGSLVLLFRNLDKTPRGQRFLFSQGGKSTDTQNAFSLFVQNAGAPADPGALVLRVGNAQSALLPASELAPGAWMFVVITWEEARKNGQIAWRCGPFGGDAPRSGTVNITQRAVVGNDGPFAIGFSEAVASSAYRDVGQPGMIDAFAIFDRELGSEEIAQLLAVRRR